MDEQPNRGLYYAGLLALFFLLAFLLAVTVFKGKEGPKGHMANKKDAQNKVEKQLPKENQLSKTDSNTTENLPQADTLVFKEPARNLIKDDPSVFIEMLQSRADSIKSSLNAGKRRTDVILRYYPHLPDGKIIYSLSDLGFYLHERPTDPNQLDQPTNSLFYGDDVPTADIQLVAYELIRRGAKIRQIRLSRFHDDWKSNSIEIGADNEAQELPVLSVADIQNFKKGQ